MSFLQLIVVNFRFQVIQALEIRCPLRNEVSLVTPVWVNQSGIDRNTFVSVSSFIFQDFFHSEFQGQLDRQSSPFFSRSIWATGQSEFKVTCNYLLGEKEMQELDTFDKISQRAISLVILSLVISLHDIFHTLGCGFHGIQFALD